MPSPARTCSPHATRPIKTGPNRGIATRAFERRFQLADHVRATDAVTENGLLHIDLVREVPEALKPRKIEITRGSNKAIEAEAAAA